jgi:hypothetical protein
MPHRFFRTQLLVAAALAVLALGCGGGAGTGDLDKIQVTLSQFEISVTNTSGRALMDVVAEIEPAGPSSHYTSRLVRLENGEKQSIAHTSFTDRDHVPFSARNTKATRVTVTAKDIDGKVVTVSVPFKM